MKNHRVLVAAIVLSATALGACGSDGGDKASFTDQLQDECRVIARGLRNIDAPTEIADFETAANDASKVYDDGLTALKKLKAPSKQASDFKDLQTNISDQVDLFDQIGTAAHTGDAATVTTKLTSLRKITADNADLADSLDAKPCAFAAVFTAQPTNVTTTTKPAKTTTTTEAPSTDAPTTLPPTTTAPATTVAPTTVAVTDPPETFPPVTAGPGTTVASTDNKTVEPLAAKLTPKGDDTFVDAPESTTSAIRLLLDLGPLFSAQPGTIGGVDVHAGGVNITRVFVFVPDADTITPGTVEEVQKTLAGSNALTPASFAGIDGQTFPSGTTTFFVAQKGQTLVIAIGVTTDDINHGLTDFVESVPA